MFRRHFFGDLFRTKQYAPKCAALFEPSAFRDEIERSWLDPTFVDALRPGGPGIREIAKELVPGVYSFPVFRPEFCDRIVEEVEHAQETVPDLLQRPNGMNRYGLVLNQIGLEPLISDFQERYMQNLARDLYPVEGSEFDDHHCFIVRYSASEDVGLDVHEDDADVTLNVCLGKDFTGATLSFCHLITDPKHRKLSHVYEHAKGHAVVHLGRHRHGADDIKSGERVNFILWSLNSKYRNSETFREHRTRHPGAEAPDRLCLSYTHDADYARHLERPSDEEALRRGVMLDQVALRDRARRSPVHDLSRPLEEINELPSLCLFLDGLAPEAQRELAGELVAVAREEQTDPPAILFFAAVVEAGAVGQIKALTGVPSAGAAAPAARLRLLCVQEGCYREPQEENAALTADGIRAFLGAWRSGGLPARPLGGGDDG